MKLLLIILLTSNYLLSQDKIVYGEDNRVEWFESDNNLFRQIALSTAAMIPKKKITVKNKSYTLKAKTLAQRGICKEARFQDQITAANCSGFLVGEDLLVTAGHCIKNMNDCNSYAWVFDFKLTSKTDKALSGQASNIYNCKEIIERKLSSFWGKNDYALIKLDRKTDRRPLQYSKKKVKEGTALVVIGHPTGLPQKIADGAEVRSTSRLYFNANLDTFGGNSGSAVFNANTGVVEGILVRGDKDYIRKNGCMLPNQVSNEQAGEEVTYIKNIRALR
ncbi:MAG: serine protease [Bacteriovoracaceae bacterium]|jgi:V8-like Glu-specific endopeptidase|nr:serine protease [Bacteriovoracaceae bacterium]